MAHGAWGWQAVLESDTELWGKDEAAFRRMKQYLDEVFFFCRLLGSGGAWVRRRRRRRRRRRGIFF